MTNGQSPTPTAPGGQNQESFWKRNQKMLVRIIIVAIIIVGAVIYAQTQNPSDENQTEQNNDQEQNGDINGDNGINVIDSSENNQQNQGSMQEQEPVRTEGETLTVVVQKGEGYTQTARRAVAEYLNTHPNDQVKAEHKIYIEDYLQKHVTEKHRLFSGNEVSYSTSDVQQAIDASLELTAGQVNNLSKYVPMVPSIN